MCYLDTDRVQGRAWTAWTTGVSKLERGVLGSQLPCGMSAWTLGHPLQIENLSKRSAFTGWGDPKGVTGVTPFGVLSHPQALLRTCSDNGISVYAGPPRGPRDGPASIHHPC